MGISGSVDIKRRNLPHWTVEGAIYWITFRLADSLPQGKLHHLRVEKEAWLGRNPEPWDAEQWQEHDARFGARVHRWLDAGYGTCVLARPQVRKIAGDCVLRFDGKRLFLHSAVIMPNHVHALIEPLGVNKLPALLKGIKGASARRVNQLLNRSGQLRMDESYDHIVRSEKEYDHFRRYIRENPTKATLSAPQYWHYEGGTDILVCEGL